MHMDIQGWEDGGIQWQLARYKEEQHFGLYLSLISMSSLITDQ